MEHFNSSLKSATWTRAAASDDLQPASATEKITQKHGCMVNNSSVPHFPSSPPPNPNSCAAVIPAAAATSTAQGYGVDIAYPSLGELIKGAVSKVLLHFVCVSP